MMNFKLNFKNRFYEKIKIVFIVKNLIYKVILITSINNNKFKKKIKKIELKKLKNK